MQYTGAYMSILLQGVLPLSEETSLGGDALIHDTWLIRDTCEMSYLRAALHTVYLKCSLVTGSVSVGLRPCIPVEGVSLILGNGVPSTDYYRKSCAF